MYKTTWSRGPQKRFRAKRKMFLSILKLERGCVDCGYRDHPDALEFDHLEKGMIPVSRLTANFDQVMKEIARCEVRCANCHTIRSLAVRRSQNGV